MEWGTRHVDLRLLLDWTCLVVNLFYPESSNIKQDFSSFRKILKPNGDVTLIPMDLSDKYNNLATTENANKHLFLRQDMGLLSKRLRPIDKKQWK
jgi:hypothetical protein